jgi:L-iditol 2-dehydrogenase
MKAVQITESGHAALIEVDDPKAGPNEVVVKVHSTGICGSDISGFLGTHPFRVPPVIAGHELAGTVTELGEGVQNLKVSDTVAVEPIYGCGKCEFCESGDYNLCKDLRVLGSSYWNGSFAESVVVPARCVYRVPPGMSLSIAAVMEPFCVGLHAADRARIEPEENVAVLGSGTIGLMTLLSVLQYNPRCVICSDIRPFNLDMALSLGATHVVNPNQVSVAEAVAKATNGKGINTCLLAAPSPDVITQAFEITRPRGRIVVIALFEGNPGINFKNLTRQEREIVGTSAYTRKDYLKAIELCPTLKTPLSHLITHRISIEHLPRMLDNLSKGKVKNAIKVLVEMEGAPK